MPEWELSPEIVNFVDNARRYCEFCEEAHAYQLGERFLRGAILMANLYTAGLFLPELPTPEEREFPNVPDLREFPGFDELTLYWQVPDAYEWGAPVVASLSEAVVNIYRDVKRGLIIFDLGYEAGDEAQVQLATWDWQHHMERTWANLAVDSLRALNRAIYKLNHNQA